MSSYYVVSPAYGRDYKTARAAEKDWEAGKDFVLHQMGMGRYCSQRDFINGDQVEIRYNEKADLTIVTI